MSDPPNPNNDIAGLIDRWCDRRELPALATLLPAYCSNNGLTAGWAELRQALRAARTLTDLPAEELTTLDDLIGQVDRIVHRP